MAATSPTVGCHKVLERHRAGYDAGHNVAAAVKELLTCPTELSGDWSRGSKALSGQRRRPKGCWEGRIMMKEWCSSSQDDLLSAV